MICVTSITSQPLAASRRGDITERMLDSPVVQAVLLLAGAFAGFINTLAGGLLSDDPLLIFMGLPPTVANGTNRFAIFLQCFLASAKFHSYGVFPARFALLVSIPAVAGAFFLAGVYGGFIQAGVAFLLLACMALTCYDLVAGNAVKVFVVLIFTFFALGIFFLEDKVQILPGLILGAGSMAGAMPSPAPRLTGWRTCGECQPWARPEPSS